MSNSTPSFPPQDSSLTPRVLQGISSGDGEHGDAQAARNAVPRGLRQERYRGWRRRPWCVVDLAFTACSHEACHRA